MQEWKTISIFKRVKYFFVFYLANVVICVFVLENKKIIFKINYQTTLIIFILVSSHLTTKI